MFAATPSVLLLMVAQLELSSCVLRIHMRQTHPPNIIYLVLKVLHSTRLTTRQWPWDCAKLVREALAIALKPNHDDVHQPCGESRSRSAMSYAQDSLSKFRAGRTAPAQREARITILYLSMAVHFMGFKVIAARSPLTYQLLRLSSD